MSRSPGPVVPNQSHGGTFGAIAFSSVPRGALDSVPVAVYLTDIDGLVTYYNAYAAELWGYDPTIGEARWCGALKLFHPNGEPMAHDQSPMAMALREATAKKGLEGIVERPDGSRVRFLSYAAPLIGESGEVAGGVNLLVDSFDQMSIAYAERLSAIVQSSRDAIVGKDLTGTITSWNPGAEQLFGYSADEAIGQSVTMLIPPDRHNEEPEILSRIRRGEPVEPYETMRRRKDGSLVNISLSVSPIRDAAGRVIGASKIAQDITERVFAREQQQLLVREINHRVKNIVATVQAIARRTISFQSDHERETFFARLSALAGANQLLTDHRGHKVPLDVVIHRALEPFRSPARDRFILKPSGYAQLSGDNASQLTMVLHELATNAAKYGALSNDDGRVQIDWSVSSQDDTDYLRLVWQERGGPSVSPPQNEGFGSQLIRRVLGGDDGEVSLEFLPNGVRCQVAMTLHRTDPA